MAGEAGAGEVVKLKSRIGRSRGSMVRKEQGQWGDEGPGAVGRERSRGSRERNEHRQ